LHNPSKSKINDSTEVLSRLPILRFSCFASKIQVRDFSLKEPVLGGFSKTKQVICFDALGGTFGWCFGVFQQLYHM
jgi:hypothetical protein